jgi:hypothetical protein
VDIGRFYGRKEGKQMSELLTTGQMIDRLKVGEVAEAKYESESGGFGISYKIERNEFGLKNITNGDGVVSFDNIFFKAKWHILPNYVSFEEAMRALKEGKKATLHGEDGNLKTLFRKWYRLDTRECITFNMMFEGKWTIEEEKK